MSDYEKVLAYLREQAKAVQGQWNGDESGEQENRASAADELLELLDEVDALVKELDL